MGYFQKSGQYGMILKGVKGREASDGKFYIVPESPHVSTEEDPFLPVSVGCTVDTLLMSSEPRLDMYTSGECHRSSTKGRYILLTSVTPGTFSLHTVVSEIRATPESWVWGKR